MANNATEGSDLGDTQQSPQTRGALSLTGIENVSSSEKSARIAALVSDIYASIIFISRHVKAGTLSNHHCKPLYELVSNILIVERKEKRKILRELKRQDSRIERTARRHQRDIKKLLELAKSGIVHLRRKAERLQMELDELKGKRKVSLGHIEKNLSTKLNLGNKLDTADETVEQEIHAEGKEANPSCRNELKVDGTGKKLPA
ncbi:hypothetical protein CPC735_036130 [Coccidioides posadasii C735 delta SOWgp]|uniref:Uncharacterized protein n=1 Tax=Coccidioides posadasii (strain C735) TaxID=222929 RepID=C5P204_COCP7|nr:hypothetical protein CPC735_036130 [Coccidioides posadasii C735 delta SOWgp]EER28907.1 hypothetical protein CPC735_036130 [Coccidioides posadasii C735 delta SOWgp]|eukprot:XP_003071052.1 hypothetical protein CPC735_036130 [Coccidioides posadasii C735 delta SOWgp]